MNKLKNDIKNLQIQDKNIEDKKNIKNYYINTMDLLESYFTNDNDTPREGNKNQTIIDFLNNKGKQKSNTLEPFVKNETKKNKKELFNKYLLEIDNKNTNMNIDYVKNYTFCENCKTEKNINYGTSLYICKNCGESNNIILEPEKPAYKETNVDTIQFSYKRYTHFIEWLNKFQGLDTTTIPREVIMNVKNELVKDKIKDMSKVDYTTMRSILKKLGYTKYYDNTFYILYRTTGNSPPRLSRELEDKLKTMFNKIKGPFEKYCPADRTNFLSYSYVLRKFFELLHEDKYIKNFQYLKSREKLYKQDLIWKKICNELKWPFIASV